LGIRAPSIVATLTAVRQVKPEINAIGRHHPSGDKFGGSTNFCYTDGHVERKAIWQTLHHREWGDKYFSLTGRNEIIGFEQ
jgi:prepilin-type processing-associated H-X9-DG protein